MRTVLDSWISSYMRGDDGTPIEQRRYPLRSAFIEVVAIADRPGCFKVTAELAPDVLGVGPETTTRIIINRVASVLAFVRDETTSPHQIADDNMMTLGVYLSAHPDGWQLYR